jgi:ABC-type multidrug transport system fused ATPase/permease subunit
MTFSFVNPLIKAGYEHPLEEEELPDLPEQDSASIHAKSLEEEWTKIKAAASSQNATATVQQQPVTTDKKGKAKKPMDWSLLKAAMIVFGPAFVWGGLWKFPHDVLSFTAPYLVRAVYKYVDPKGQGDKLPTWSKGLGICMTLFLMQLLSSVALHQYFDRVFLCSLQTRGALVSAIYGKSLRLSHASRGEKSLGELVNLMSVDVQRLTDLIPYLHNLLWSSPLQMIVSVVLLYRLVGVSALVGLGVMLAIMPINGRMLHQMRRLQESNMKEKDKRVKTVSEILHSMKVIKMFAWEKPLTKRVSEIRENEVKRLKKYGYLSSVQSIFWNSAPITVSIATFGTYTALGNKLDLQVRALETHVHTRYMLICMHMFHTYMHVNTHMYS